VPARFSAQVLLDAKVLQVLVDWLTERLLTDQP